MRRRHEEEDHVNHEAWAIPYGDLITLLLAFFVVMYAVSSVNEGKYRVLSDSLTAAFRGTPKATVPIQIGDKVVKVQRDDTVAGITPTQALKLASPMASEQTSLVEQFQRMGRDLEKDGGDGPGLRQLADQVELAMAELIEKNLVTVTRKPLWVEVEIKTDILFPSGSAQIQPEAVDILGRIASILEPLGSPIRVEGHTDNQPIRTLQFPSNWELSAARAGRIVRLFEERGIGPERMSVAGQGEYQPVADNATPEGRNRNRRVTVVLDMPPALKPRQELVVPAQAGPAPPPASRETAP
ncbi:MAG: flagellar motor protein MotD [Gammaproteobacteria bacterium]|nr:flagellar motor protein MotD [Gammaproteobacteria bacterium]